MIGRSRSGLLAVIGLLAFAVARALHLDALTLPIGFGIVGWVPGLALLRLLNVRIADRPTALALASALSIPVSAAITCGLAFAGVPLSAGIAGVVIASALLLLAMPTTDVDRGASSPPALVGISAVAGLLVLVMVQNPYVRNWSDAWFHVAVFNEVVARGVPPGFPHFAGESLPYPWLFHAWLGAISRWLSPDPTVLMAALNVFTAMTLPLVVFALARSAGARVSHAVIAAAIFLIGIHPLGGPLLLARCMIGNDAGWEALRFTLAETTRTMVTMTLGFPNFDATLWARFGTATAFNYALVIAGGCWWFASELWERPSVRLWLGFALAAASLFMWHTLTAYVMVIGLVGACGLGALANLVARHPIRAVLQNPVLTAAGIAAGYAIAFPYLHLVTHGAGGGKLMRLTIGHEDLVALALAGGPIMMLAVARLMRPSDESRATAWWAGGVIAIASAFVIFDLPGTAEEKLFYPLMLVTAPLAGTTLAAWWGRGGWSRAVIAMTASAGLLSIGLVVFAFAHDARPLRSLFDDAPPPGVTLFTDDEARAMRWVRDQSPARAVFLQAARPTSNEPILVFGARRLFLGPAEFFYRAIFFPSGGKPPMPTETWNELLRRRRVQELVFSGSALDDSTTRSLTASRDPLYIWADARLGGGALSPTVTSDPARFRPVLKTPQVTIYEVELLH